MAVPPNPDSVTEYVELPGRVFSVTRWPASAPGRCRRYVRVAVESGPELTQDEADRVLADVVADLVSRGIDVSGWGFAEE